MAPKLSGKESKMSMRLRIFGRRGSGDTYDENDSNVEEDNEQASPSEHPERMSSLGAMTRLVPPPPGLFGQVPYINPRGHKLEARVEVSTLPRNNRAGALDQMRGPRAVRPESQESESAPQNPKSQDSEEPKSESGATETTPLPTLPMARQLTKAQKQERRERRRRKRERRHRSRAKKICRRGPYLRLIPKNRGGTADNLPDTPPHSDGERNHTSANKISQLDDHIAELDALAELSDRQNNSQLLELREDLAWKTTWNTKQAKQKLYRGYDLNNLNDIPNDEESVIPDEYDSQSEGESEGEGKSESGESVDTVGPQTYHLAVEGNVATTPEPPEASEYQLVERSVYQWGDQSEDDRAQFIYIIAAGAAKAECFIEPWVKYLESYSLVSFHLCSPLSCLWCPNVCIGSIRYHQPP